MFCEYCRVHEKYIILQVHCKRIYYVKPIQKPTNLMGAQVRFKINNSNEKLIESNIIFLLPFSFIGVMRECEWLPLHICT